MNGLVEAVIRRVGREMLTRDYEKDGCSVSMNDAPVCRAVVDFDSEGVDIPKGSKRCDLLFVGEKENAAWVVPIELKSGGFKVQHATDQLQSGADAADRWLPRKCSFRFAPVLAHGGVVRTPKRTELRKRRVNLRGFKRQPFLISCGDSLASVFGGWA